MNKRAWSTLFKKSTFQWSLFTVIAILLINITYVKCNPARPVSRKLKTLLNATSDTPQILLNEHKKVFNHYHKNDFKTFWTDESGNLLPYANALIERIKNAGMDGLNPTDYHLEEIKLMSATKTNDSLFAQHTARTDALLTDAFITYSTHLYAGRVHTIVYNKDWALHVTEISPADSLKYLEEGLGLSILLSRFDCPHPQYHFLQQKLQDCYVSRDSAALSRIRQITINMERWRWMPRKLSQEWLMANIAAFELVAGNEQDMLKMKIITGKLEQPTPLFHAKMEYMILHPWWEIPQSIAKKEMLPAIKKDRGYFEKNHIKVYAAENFPATEINCDTIDWQHINAHNFPYRLRQSPGPWNALGQIKFIFPNDYSVYFHDTPQRALFSKTIRAFSHGCIRIEKPVELAAMLLKMNTSQIYRMLENNKERIINLPSAPMVYICYLTAWEDETGALCFANDIYGEDKKIADLFWPRSKQIS